MKRYQWYVCRFGQSQHRDRRSFPQFYAGFYCDLLRGILEKVNLCKCQHQQTEDNSDGVLLDEKPYS